MRTHRHNLFKTLGLIQAKHLLVLTCLCVSLAVAGALALVLLDARRDDIADAGRELSNLALILSEKTDKSLQAVELVQRALSARLRATGIGSAADLQRDGGSIAVFHDLLSRTADLPQGTALALTDPDGKLINFSRYWPPPPNQDADRDFIRGVLAPDAPPLFISAPSRSRGSGRWTIYLSRRLTDEEGNLIGIIVAALEPDELEELFARISISGQSTFALYRNDGVLLARYPHVDQSLGRAFGATANFIRLKAATDQGHIRLDSMFDGRDRLVAPHSVPHYPLIIAASDTMDSVLVGWREQVGTAITGFALLQLVLAAVVILGWLHFRNRDALTAAEAGLAVATERERGALALHEQSQRFDVALNNMVQGLLMFDAAGRLLLVNHRFCQMFGVPDGALTPGMAYGELTDRVVAAGQVGDDDMREVRRSRAELIAAKQRAVVTWAIESGRAFNVTHQPMADGWLATFEEISDRRNAEARMVHLAQHDTLTDLPNRILFREKLELGLMHVRRGGILALFCLDLDQFKAVNDTLGHPIGDQLLQAVAERLLQRTREGDTVARLGGDEFAIVLAPIEYPAVAIGLANRLIELFEEPFDVAGHQIVIGTSIGLAFAPQDGTDGDQLLKNADLALYRAKTDGRGVFRLFHAEMDAAMQQRRQLEVDLRQALRNGEFELFYQPLVDLRVGAVTGLEALLRWHHPARGVVSPASFIPLAEEIGLIVPIGEWVLREACAAAAAWGQAMRIAVNLSPAQFKSRNLVGAVSQALLEARLPADRLELEITESVMLNDTEATLATLHQLRALGVGIAMDDFGTGYSSLSYLRRFPFDRIKIDQSFVRELGCKADCEAIVRAVAALSRDLGMATTAEGVETREQLEQLAGAGCTEVQGYLFSPALPKADLAARIRTIAEMLRQPTDYTAPEPVE